MSFISIYGWMNAKTVRGNSGEIKDVLARTPPTRARLRVSRLCDKIVQEVSYRTG